LNRLKCMPSDVVTMIDAPSSGCPYSVVTVPETIPTALSCTLSFAQEIMTMATTEYCDSLETNVLALISFIKTISSHYRIRIFEVSSVQKLFFIIAQKFSKLHLN